MLTRILSTLAVVTLPLVAGATEYQTVERPRQECWNEQVPVQTASPDYGGAIIGGIAGGLLGNQVGGGNGKTVATAVGAMTGAVVGDRMSARGPSYQTQTVRRCRTVVDQVQVPVVREQVPVYVEPRPVVVRPRPVVVVEQPVYYIQREERWPRERHGRHHHRHDDDDDD